MQDRSGPMAQSWMLGGNFRPVDPWKILFRGFVFSLIVESTALEVYGKQKEKEGKKNKKAWNGNVGDIFHSTW